VGVALVSRDGLDFRTWGEGNTAKSDVRHSELALEREVSKFIGNMPFLWLAIEDEVGSESRGGYIEKNSIAFLSNYNKAQLDLPSPFWLGYHCHRAGVRDAGLRVRTSGLWNSNRVDEIYDPAFLDELERLISATGGAL
jgi:hypothetical protein